MDIPNGILVPHRIANDDAEIFGIEIIEGFYTSGERFDYPDSDDE